MPRRRVTRALFWTCLLAVAIYLISTGACTGPRAGYVVIFIAASFGIPIAFLSKRFWK